MLSAPALADRLGSSDTDIQWPGVGVDDIGAGTFREGGVGHRFRHWVRLRPMGRHGLVVEHGLGGCRTIVLGRAEACEIAA